MQKITVMTAHKNNSGQALLFVVVALAISMVVGVSISTRTLSLSRRVSNTDTHSRVYYSAEAGIERFVNLSMDELEAIANNTDCAEAATGSEQNDDGSSCTFDLGDDIETSTEVTVESITYNETDPANHFALELGNGSFGGVNLYNATANRIRICWENPQSAVYYSLWNANGVRYKNILKPNDQVMSNITGAVEVGSYASYSSVYPYCYTVQLSTNPIYLILAPINAGTKIGVFPFSNSLPPQGYRITSKARLKSDDTNQVQVTKVIEVVRSFDYVPGFFDNAIYAQGAIREED